VYEVNGLYFRSKYIVVCRVGTFYSFGIEYYLGLDNSTGGPTKKNVVEREKDLAT